jgi:hypothetical protein
MPPPDGPPPPAVLGRADFEQLLDAIRATITEAASVPALLDGLAARRYLGLSKTGWHRAKSAGLLPKSVHVDGSGERWRKTDLDRFTAGLKPRRSRKREADDWGDDTPLKK